MLLIDDHNELHKRINLDLFINNACEVAKRIEDLEFHYKKKKEGIITQETFDLEFEHIIKDAIVYADRVLNSVDTIEESID
jgi:hypothetical protein